MELPIARESYRASGASLVRAIRRAEVTRARTAAEETPLEGAIAFTNPARAAVRMVNYAADLHLPEGGDPAAVVRGVLDHFRGEWVPCHKMYPVEAACPPPLAAALAAEGYTPRAAALYRLDEAGPPRHTEPALQVIPGRAAYAEVRRLHRTGAISTWGADDAVADQLADTHVDFLDEPRLEVFLGRLERRPVGLVALVSLGNIGVIDDVFTDPDFRGRGVASALLAHAMEYGRRALFDELVLETTDDNPAAKLYEELGFRRVTEFYQYRREG